MTDPEEQSRNVGAHLNARIAYLSGSHRAQRSVRLASDDAALVPGTRYELDILGIGREQKSPPNPPHDPSTWQMGFADLLIGAWTYGIPVAFGISSDPAAGVRFSLGTWTRETAQDEECNQRIDVLRALLDTLYPSVTVTTPRSVTASQDRAGWASGLVTGHPTVRPPTEGDNVLPVDRVLRALRGLSWEVRVLAGPESDTTADCLRQALIEELTFALNAQRASGQELPAVKQLSQVVETTLQDLLDASAAGSWRTAVYLHAPPATYSRLASVWRGVHSGRRSKPEAIHVTELENPDVDLIGSWSIPLDSATEGSTSEYAHPFRYQTLLSSYQLAGYVHLPSQEVVGFRTDLKPRFDVAAPRERPPEGTDIPLGTVIDRARPPPGPRDADPGPEGPRFRVSAADLSRHTFIAGVTGSGKTNTNMHLLRGLHRVGVPWLVLEPVKSEYRQLAAPVRNDPHSQDLASRLQVFSVGAADGVQLQLNPFEVGAGTSVVEHIDLLRSVFAASFGDMWTPLPQVLEQCMHRIYIARGWNLETGRNGRLGDLTGDDDATSLAFPTLGELAAVVEEVVDGLGFDPEARDRVIGSLLTRIDGLRVGSKGSLFDTRRSFPVTNLLDTPTVVELERLADESDKAFLMGLLVIRLVEFRRHERRQTPQAFGASQPLRHVLVIEEAHRLLSSATNTPSVDNTARAMAVESFANLLAEIRAYGQGIVVLDQIPTKLAPDVIKNTNLKIAHRVVDEADRSMLAGSMGMNDGQKQGLTALASGEAAVFGDGDDSPRLVRIDPPPVPDPSAEAPASGPYAGEGVPAPTHWGCACAGRPTLPEECSVAAALADDDEVRTGMRRVLSAALLAGGIGDQSGSELAYAVRRVATGDLEELTILGCLAARGGELVADEWGTSRGWSFFATREFAKVACEVLREVTSRAATGDRPALAETLVRYQQQGSELLARRWDPFPRCNEICNDELVGLCLYRDAAASALDREDILSVWEDARANESPDDAGYPLTWDTCVTIVAPEILGPDAGAVASRAAALCFAQQAIAVESPRWPPWIRDEFVDVLLLHASGGMSASEPSEPTTGIDTSPGDSP